MEDKMKIIISAVLLVLFISGNAYAQTATQIINKGKIGIITLQLAKIYTKINTDA